MCPVRIWASIVQRLRSYPSFNPSDTVNKYQFSDGRIHFFSGPELLKKLRLAATAIGPDSLGFTAADIGLHSARSGAAMAMYLAKVPVFTIMLLGQWSSNAFLRYVCKQVKEFSKGISTKMIQNENFFTIPSSSREEPRISHHPLNLASQNHGPLNFKETVRPLVSVFH